jgi:hypothetical protein
MASTLSASSLLSIQLQVESWLSGGASIVFASGGDDDFFSSFVGSALPALGAFAPLGASCSLEVGTDACGLGATAVPSVSFSFFFRGVSVEEVEELLESTDGLLAAGTRLSVEFSGYFRV